MLVRSDLVPVGEIDDLRSVLRGERGRWAAIAAADPVRFCRVADAHGVLPLLAEASARAVPGSPLARLLHDRLRTTAACDAILERALAELTSACQTAGVDALLMKGADVAYGFYPRPHVRPRVDTDLLVEPGMREAAAHVLRSLGYRDVAQTGGDLLMYQQPFVRHDGAVAHTVDLHWRISNPQRFGSTLTFHELWTASQPRPAIGPAARGLAPMHAMVLSCVHRVAHHYDVPRLIWTYDLRVLADHLTAADWTALVALAGARRLAGPCARGLSLAVSEFAAAVPPWVVPALDAAARREPAIDPYLGSGRRHVARVLSDFSHLPSWPDRLRLARQHLFPPARYMRDVYAPGSAMPLPWLYVRRAWSGARRWMARA